MLIARPGRACPEICPRLRRLIDCDGYRCFFFREPDGVLFGVATLRGAPASARPRFELPQPSEIPPRIARPIGILAAA